MRSPGDSEPAEPDEHEGAPDNAAGSTTAAPAAQSGRFFAKVLADQQYQRGREYEAQGYWERALASYRRACGLDPTSVLFLLARGKICQAYGLEPEAEDCYAAALRLRPTDPVALYNQAQLFTARGELDAARANLKRILSGDVDVLGERAAPIYCRLGDIALRREDYRCAGRYFSKALDASPGHRYAVASLGALARLQEFRHPVGSQGQVPPKIAAYAYAGAVVLGMPDDDGISIPLSPGLGFDSLAEVAQTLARFTALASHCEWPLEVVAALDQESQPLAIALATALGVVPALSVDAVSRGAAAAGVTAAGESPAALGAAAAALRGRARSTLLYAVGLRHPLWEYDPSFQVISLPVRLEFPWNRGEARAPEHAEAFGTELGQLLCAARPDGTLDAQLAWYASHSRLAFPLHGPTSQVVETDMAGAAGFIAGVVAPDVPASPEQRVSR